MSSESPWSAAAPVAGATPDSREPSLALVGETAHLMWSKNKALYHAQSTPEGWTEPQRVANGEQPALAVDAGGRLHCLFTHQFLGNYEIFHITWDGATWSLPQTVSRTSGVSNHPALAADAQGNLQGVWADTTPGYSVIYIGRHESGEPFWSSEAIPGARGSTPTIALAPNGDVYVAWQDRRGEAAIYDIFCAVQHEGAWSTAAIVSDTPACHSLYPQLATNKQGGCHLVWEEQVRDVYQIRHSDLRPGGWATPVDVSASAGDCRLPRIAANRQGHLQVVWLEGSTLYHRVRPPEHETNWWLAETTGAPRPSLSDLTLATSHDGQAFAVWSSFDDAGLRRLYSARRGPVFKHTVLLPIIT